MGSKKRNVWYVTRVDAVTWRVASMDICVRLRIRVMWVIVVSAGLYWASGGLHSEWWCICVEHIGIVPWGINSGWFPRLSRFSITYTKLMPRKRDYHIPGPLCLDTLTNCLSTSKTSQQLIRSLPWNFSRQLHSATQSAWPAVTFLSWFPPYLAFLSSFYWVNLEVRHHRLINLPNTVGKTVND